jgi:hypothetical protein
MMSSSSNIHWFHHNNARLFSFISWCGSYEEGKCLSDQGFYYFGMGRTVSCIGCGTCLAVEKSENLRVVHQVSNPGCMLYPYKYGTTNLLLPLPDDSKVRRSAWMEALRNNAELRKATIGEEKKKKFAYEGLAVVDGHLQCVMCNLLLNEKDPLVQHKKLSPGCNIFIPSDP